LLLDDKLIPIKTRLDLEKQQYRIIGNHSAVKICHWTKAGLVSDRVCFKQKWYNIRSHRCLQCSTWLACLNKCIYCWRSVRSFGKTTPIDEPSELIDEMIKQQRLLLSGFKGYEKVDKKKWKESQNPNNVALSLIGESLLYPKLSEVLKEFHKRKFTSFLVTKGTLPKKLSALDEEPTNLYISVCAPDKEIYEKVDRPLIPNGWEKQMESLELMKSFNCNKVIRITLVKGWNMNHPEKYAKLILKAEPDFIEPKAFIHIGEAQQRLPRDTMPSMEDVREFAKKLSEFTEYIIKDEDIASRVVLLTKK